MIRRDIDEATEQRLRSEVKDQLRRRMRSLRRVLPAEARKARSLAICTRICELPEFENAKAILGYRAMTSEADPGVALDAAFAAGKTIALPRVMQDGSLDLRGHAQGSVLTEGAFGIEEPGDDAPAIGDDDVDLVLIPALAFDERGHRIGYGRGYYDRLLPRLTKAFKVVIGYDFQYVVQVPDLALDVPADAVVTDARTVLAVKTT